MRDLFDYMDDDEFHLEHDDFDAYQEQCRRVLLSTPAQ